MSGLLPTYGSHTLGAADRADVETCGPLADVGLKQRPRHGRNNYVNLACARLIAHRAGIYAYCRTGRMKRACRPAEAARKGWLLLGENGYQPDTGLSGGKYPGMCRGFSAPNNGVATIRRIPSGGWRKVAG